MKKFITVIPQQPAGQLNKVVYEPVENRKLKFEEGTRFPIIPVLNAYAEKGEKVRVLAIRQNYDNCFANGKLLEEEIGELLAKDSAFVLENGIEFIDIPFDESAETHIDTFQKLLEYIEEDDELYACVTFGSKPLEIVENMSLRYAEAVVPGARVKCIVYGSIDRTTRDNLGHSPFKIYDITSLMIIQNTVELIKDKKLKNVKELLNAIIG